MYRRGYAEAEIEAVFAKYDLDGDRALDEDELRKMQADLEGQRVSRSSSVVFISRNLVVILTVSMF